MSIADEISRIQGNIADAYGAVEEMGGTVPIAQEQNSANLPATISSIPTTIGVGAPVGTIQALMSTTPPDGYLVCDGATYPIADYPELAAHFKNEFGASNYFGGDGATTFGVPDLRNLFLRGYHGDADEQYSTEIGMKQAGTLLPTYWSYVDGTAIRHTIVGSVGNAPTNLDRDTSENNLSTYRVNASATLSSVGSDDVIKMGVRPSNMAVLYCICAIPPVAGGGGSVTDEEYQALLDRVTALEALPTIEEYTSSNWHVRKWSNGYLELSLIRGISITATQFSASGSVYICPSTIFTQLVYPVAFKEIYSKAITPVQGTSGFYILSPGATQSYPLTRTDLIHIARPGAPSATATYTVSYHITGRWK